MFPAMFDVNTASLIVVLLLLLVFLGVHVAVALGHHQRDRALSGHRQVSDRRGDACQHGGRGPARLHLRRHSAVHADGRVHRAIRGDHRHLCRDQPLHSPPARPPCGGDRAWQCDFFVRHRGQHRVGRRLFPDRLSRDEKPWLRPWLRARHHRRQLLPRHAHPAERPDDRLGHPHRAVDRPPVPGGRAAGRSAGRSVPRLYHRNRLAAAGRGR